MTNKCVGLDCEMCANTKCPNEEKEKIIDGIDASECLLFDKKTGCYHTFNGECAKDSCAVYKWLLEYKRLQEENEELRQARKNSPDIQEPYVYLYRQIKKQCHKLEEKNEKLKADLKGETEQAQKWYQLETDKHFQMLEYEQALKKIKERVQSSLNKADGYVILEIINEVLND